MATATGDRGACQFPDCERPRRYRQFCQMHHTRQRLYGDPAMAGGRRIIPLEQRFWSKVDVRGPDECWEWQGSRDQIGYGKLFVSWKSNREERAHRVSYFLDKGSWPSQEAPEVLHRCDNPPCVNPAHLEAGTHSDNMRDMVSKGRHNAPHGERVGTSKLSTEIVLAIRAAAESGVTQRSIARQFATSQANVSDIVLRKRWAHV